jgi:hypothetical protein
MGAEGITLTLGHVSAIVAVIVAIVGSGVGLVIGILGYFIRRAFEGQASDIAEIRKFNEWVRTELVKYEVNVGASDTSLKAIHSDLNDHVMREESIFWKKIEAIQEASRIQNETVLQRITSMEARMPNGELKSLAKDVASLVAEMAQVKRTANLAEEHVISHNEEAEVWKREIRVSASRLDRVESDLRDLVSDRKSTLLHRRSTDEGR